MELLPELFSFQQHLFNDLLQFLSFYLPLLAVVTLEDLLKADLA